LCDPPSARLTIQVPNIESVFLVQLAAGWLISRLPISPLTRLTVHLLSYAAVASRIAMFRTRAVIAIAAGITAGRRHSISGDTANLAMAPW
jgi:hypothetical protein